MDVIVIQEKYMIGVQNHPKPLLVNDSKPLLVNDYRALFYYTQYIGDYNPTEHPKYQQKIYYQLSSIFIGG